MQWFRFYNEVLNDEKVQCLPDATFKFWVNILCLASKRDGKIPDNDAVSFALRLPLHAVTCMFLELAAAGLLDGKDETRSPHNWKKRQFKSDTSKERVKRYRKRHSNVTRTVTETPPEQIHNRTDSDTEQSKLLEGSIGKISNGLVGMFGKSLSRNDPFNGKVIKLTPADMVIWFQHWSGTETEFHRWLKSRDNWYAGQTPAIQKNWWGASVRKIKEMEAA